MRCDSHDLYQHLILFDPVDHKILNVQARRAITLPLTAQRLVSETLDLFQSVGTTDRNNVFPLLVPLQHLVRQYVQLLAYSPMFEGFPHTK